VLGDHRHQLGDHQVRDHRRALRPPHRHRGEVGDRRTAAATGGASRSSGACSVTTATSSAATRSATTASTTRIATAAGGASRSSGACASTPRCQHLGRARARPARPALEHAEIWIRSRHLAVVEGSETTDAIDITYK